MEWKTRAWIVVKPDLARPGMTKLTAELRVEHGDTAPGYGWDDEPVVLSAEVSLAKLRKAVRKLEQAERRDAKLKKERVEWEAEQAKLAEQWRVWAAEQNVIRAERKARAERGPGALIALGEAIGEGS